MKKLLYLILFFSFFFLPLVFTQEISAVDNGCCTGASTGGKKNIACESKVGALCASGIKACDTKENVNKQVDVDGDNTKDTYNPRCFIPIVAPKEVRITDFGKLFSGVVAFLLLVAFILSFFFLILGGISWLTSGGDKAAVENARNKIIAAIVGLIIVAATWALFQLVGGAIGFNILQGFEVPRLF